MRETKDFDTEKKIYIGKVLDHIHYKKLHTRIYEEISSHMDDMYEDFSANCDDEVEVTKKVLEEMGHPHYLGLELKKANRVKLFWARVFKIACIFLTLPILYSTYVLITHIGMEVSDYFQADDIKTKEQFISEEYNFGKPIKLLTEIERNGIIYRFYVPQKQSEDDFEVYYTKSIEIFGINIKDKFNIYGRCFTENSTIGYKGFVLVEPDVPTSDYDCLYFFTKSTDTKYIKIYYEPFSNNDVEPYWSDYIEIPQNGTIDNPKYILIDCPNKYGWSKYQRFDGNKEPIENSVSK